MPGTHAFHVGQKVEKTLHGVGGFTEVSDEVYTVLSVGDTVVIESDDDGDRYEYWPNGREKDIVVPPFYTTIRAHPTAG